MITSTLLKNIFSSSRRIIRIVKFVKCSNVDLSNILLYIISKNCENILDLTLIGRNYIAEQGNHDFKNITDYTILAQVLRKLRTLIINDENVKDNSILILIESNTQLKSLRLNKMYRLNPSMFLEALNRITHLKKLNLNLCYQMTDLTSIFQKHSGHLTSLKLENIQLKKDSLNEIFRLKQLQVLNLACNRNVTEDFVINIAIHLSKLEKLNLNNCSVTNRALEGLTFLGDQMKKLELASTEITHLGMKFFLNFTSLSFLNISNNNIADMVKQISSLLSRLPSIRTIGLNGYEQLVIETANSYHVTVK